MTIISESIKYLELALKDLERKYSKAVEEVGRGARHSHAVTLTLLAGSCLVC